MKKSVIVLGDPLSSGGSVVSTSQTFITAEGIPIATIGDSTFCPIPLHWSGTIVEGLVYTTIFGKAIAYDGCKASCGCTLVAKQALNKVFVGMAKPDSVSSEGDNKKDDETTDNEKEDSNKNEANESNEEKVFSSNIAAALGAFNSSNKDAGKEKNNEKNKDSSENGTDDDEYEHFYYCEVVYADTNKPVENICYKLDGMPVQEMKDGKTIKSKKEFKKFRYWIK
ncbi:PAAR domain-containing protein [Pigmentibacter ruber]|uniref:PAAR domain-containing protein n=1 Tax=Pigmentibacter ruber TaxID=2683196 RepID=UPI00131D6D7B|nr:PAAR domain-containing protein [Pigmentibacter ruber]